MIVSESGKERRTRVQVGEIQESIRQDKLSVLNKPNEKEDIYMVSI